jgi:predicted kinase
MKTLYLPVGLPQSGKSTWARQQGVPIVNPDSIRLAIHGQPFFAPAEPLVWATAKIMVRSLFTAGHNNVILDATSVTKSRRDQWNSTEWACRYVVFNTDPDVCIKRAGDNTVLVRVIHRMVGEYERVDITDNWMAPKPIEHDRVFEVLTCGCPRRVLSVDEGWQPEYGHPSLTDMERHNAHRYVTVESKKP